MDNPILKKKKNLSLKQRIEILEKLDKGKKPSDLADEYNVGCAAISNIKKRREDILRSKELMKNCGGNLEKKRIDKTEDKLLEKKIYFWFTQQRSMGRPVTGAIIKRQAKIFHDRLYGTENGFVASNGWLSRFKKRHGIRSLSIEGEKLSADPNASAEFKEKLNNLIKVTGIAPEYIYNCDETGLYWEMMPNKSFVQKKEKQASGSKIPKSRVTIMVCTNATGTHKIPLFVIGKYKQPRCFKGVKTLPVFYNHQKNALMDCDLMIKWYNDIFIPSVILKHDLRQNKHIKLILIMDNAPCHPSEDLLNSQSDFCTILYLSPNVTSLIQPMEQGVIDKFKKNYRHRLLTKVIAEDDNGVDFLEIINLLDCFNFCALAWHDVSADSIKNCWKKLVFDDDESTNLPELDMQSIEFHDLHVLLTKLADFKDYTVKDVVDWVNIDDDQVGWKTKSDEEIFTDTPDPNTTTDELNDTINQENEGDELNNINVEHIPLDQVYSTLKFFLKWYLTYDKCDLSTLQSLKQCEHEIIEKMINMKT